ncbi:MvaI/BcnI restriction endonuclease family [Actinobacteria bacterium IMCC26207]|nr:MvaI/BcnI restriction endonuclease family [Actinobacteria bacterium IMCC26207]
MSASQREYDAWLERLTLQSLESWFQDLGCDQVLIKELQPNNNSKQQIYLGPHLNDVAGIPSGDPVASTGRSAKHRYPKPIFTVPVDFAWLAPGGIAPAPAAKMIYYPQYPEVRLSGLLTGCAEPPSELLNIDKRGKEVGRLLLMGVAKRTSKVFALIVPVGIALHGQVRSLRLEQQGIIRVWRLPATSDPVFQFDPPESPPSLVAPVQEQLREVEEPHLPPPITDSRALLLQRLCAISGEGWIPGQRMTTSGVIPYQAKNGGGFTLEARLGIVSNAEAGPDFHGWEVKQHNAHSLIRPRAGQVTLFDPAPDGGFYKELGPADFLRKYGRLSADAKRWDFTSRHQFGVRHATTGMQLVMSGYSPGGLNPNGFVGLTSASGDVTMSWSFAKLMGHWKNKHAQAVFVSSVSRETPNPNDIGSSQVNYQYAPLVHLGIGTQFGLFLDAILAGTIKFDPGLNVKQSADGKWKSHSRYSFRISSRDLNCLYDDFLTVEACSGVVVNS